jgi:hypothetical protein
VCRATPAADGGRGPHPRRELHAGVPRRQGGLGGRHLHADGGDGDPVTPDNICAILSVTEQESGFRADPPIPNLAKIAWAEIERQREKIGIPTLVLDAALSVSRRTGRPIASASTRPRTERQLSDIFEEMIDRVPLGRTFFAERNPGAHRRADAGERRLRGRARQGEAVSVSGRRVDPRRGLHAARRNVLRHRAPAGLPGVVRPLPVRYADFNAGHYASRNAAFQAALAQVAETKLALDGDLVRPGQPRDAPPGETEAAARTLSRDLGMDAAQIRRDLEQGKGRAFDGTELYRRVFELADRRAGKPLPRAVVPTIDLQSAKFTRPLTTQWFAERVVGRHRQCLARAGKPA